MIAGSVSAFTLMRMRACFAVAAPPRDRADLARSALAQVERRGEQLAQALRPPEAGQVVEEVGDVGADVRVGGEEAEVLVERAR